MDTVQGAVEQLIYSDNNFSIVNIRERATNRKIVALLNANIVVGEYLITKGIWATHSTFGKQFKVKEFSRNIPPTEDGVLALLASGLIKGIGPKTAKSMIKTFGTDVVKMIESHDDRLLKIPGIGPKRLTMIEKQWHAFYGREHIIGMLASSGFSIGLIKKITGYFGDEMIDTLRDNPYALVTLPGVGFYRADRFAKSLGISEKHPKRIEEALILLLEHNDQGHTYLPRVNLLDRFISLIKFSDSEVDNKQKEELVDKAIQQLILDKRVVQSGEQIHSAYLYYCESNIASILVDKYHFEHIEQAQPKTILDMIAKWESRKQIILTQDQRNAVVKTFLGNVLVMTGSPGSGKTSTISVILEVADKLHLQTELCAPTGRAAKRMYETTGKSASTIHKLLEYGRSDEFIFGYNKKNKLEVDLLIVDEISMVDVSLMSALLDAISLDTRLVLVGDDNQLQSVAAGNVLYDIIDSGKITIVELVHIFRQDPDAMLVKNAQKIKSGHIKGNFNPLSRGNKWGTGDFFITDKVNMDTIIDIAVKHIPKSYGTNLEDILFLTPLRKEIGQINCTTLNRKIQEIYNKFGAPIPFTNSLLRVGDKVMQMKNNYTKDVFNGDIGKLLRYVQGEHKDSGVFWVDFYGKEVPYEFVEQSELSLAYASTIHKAQGSEADSVVVILPADYASRNMLTRNLLYTGITRAKKVCVLIANDKEIIKAIRTPGNQQRFTDLKDKIIYSHFKYKNRKKEVYE